MVIETPVRLLSLNGCANFRDLGGYQTDDGRSTRWRRLFRSDSLHQLTAEDVDQLTALDAPLAAGFDLRSPIELTNTGAGLLYERGARHHHVPLVREVNPSDASGGTTGLRYLERLEHGRECFTSMFGLLAEADSYPAVFYCAAGKDRTGIVAAVLLRALGVSDEQIVADYALTQPISPERREARLKELGWNITLDPALFLAAPESMASFLLGLDEKYGSVEGYLETCAVTRTQIAAVRDHLLE